MKLRICSWGEYQHYKERNPPWIKLHTSLLTSRLWVSLDDASRVLAIASMLIASRDNGEFEADPDYFQRVAYLNKKPNWKPLLDKGFCEIISGDCGHASNMLADASNMHANARPEKRREEEIRDRDREETYYCSEPRNAPAEPTAQATPPSIMEYPCSGKPNVWHLSQEFVDEHQPLYPGIDVLQECRAALAWIRANPTKRKTAGGMPRFLINWFNKSQDRARGAAQRPQHPTGPVHDDEEEFQREMQKVRDRLLPTLNRGNAA